MTLIETRLRRGLLLLCVASMCPVAEAERTLWPILTGCVAALAGGLLRRAQRELPRAVIHIGALSSVGILMLETQLLPERTPAVLALAHFLILLASCKFLEPLHRRDMGVLLVISLLLLIVGGIVSGSVAYAATVALCLAVGVPWLIQFQQWRDQDAIALRAAAADASAPAPQPPAARGKSWRTGWTLSAAMLTVAGVVFVMMPRGLGRHLFGRFRTPIPGAVTGYTEQVELRSAGLFEIDNPVMRVRVLRDGAAFGGAETPLYLRGRTFAYYERGRWRPDFFTTVRRVAGAPLDEPQNLSGALAKVPPEQLVSLDVWLENRRGPTLFALYPPLAVAAGEGAEIEQDNGDLSLRLRRYGGYALRYTVTSAVLVPLRAVDVLDTERRLRIGLSAPEASLPSDEGEIDRPPPRPASRIPDDVRSLAGRLARSVGDPARHGDRPRIVGKFVEFLRHGDFTYTLDAVPRERNRDELSQFLFDNRRGRCEHFASALAVFCQAVDIPARLTSGYLATEYNPVGGFYLVRQRDAHAWVEVRLPNRGWVAFDPTPGREGAERGGGRNWIAALSSLAQFLQFEWVTFVVSFDSDYRRKLLGRFEGWFRDPSGSALSPAYLWGLLVDVLRGPPELQRGQRVLYWVMLALCTLMAVLVLRALWLTAKMLRAYVPRRRLRPREPRLADARFYDRVLATLARHGFHKPAALTPREFAAQLAGEDPARRDLLTLTGWFYAAQYGRQTFDAAQRMALRDALRRLRQALGAAPANGNSPQPSEN